MKNKWMVLVLLFLAGVAQAQQGIEGSGVSHLVVHPYDGKRVVAAFGQGVYVTRDAGIVWRQVLPETGQTERLFVHPGHPNIVYAKKAAFGLGLPIFPGPPSPVQGGGLYRSTDFGETWSLLAQDGGQPSTTFEPRVVTPVAADPTDPMHLFGTRRGGWTCRVGCIFSDLELSLHESRDGGVTWSGPLFDPGRSAFVHISYPTPADPGRLFVVVQGYAAHLSIDGGRTWTRFATSFTHTPFWVEQDPHDKRILYASGTLSDGTRNVIARSDDGGHAWRVIHAFPPQEWNVGRLTLDPYRPGRLWLSVHTGLMRSEDRGATWTSMGFASGARQMGNPGERLRVAKVVPSPADFPQAYLVMDSRLLRQGDLLRPNLAVEYRYGDRYWMSADRGETASQDYRANEAVRTGQRFGLWGPLERPAGAVPVCRFQGDRGHGQTSRFLALAGFECDIVKGSAQFVLEGEGEYFAVPPSETGACASGLVPVRRFNNLQADVNHRYVADPALAEQMRAAGWYDEGVRMCARPLGSNE